MLINIQFLRFAAAFLVVLYHASQQLAAAGAGPGPVFSAGAAAGFAGVDVFFVISGFIMFYTTRGDIGGADASGFARRRLARIYSGYWPFFVLAAIVFAWARPDHFELSNLWASFLLWPMPLDRVLLDVSWTLSFELYFYLLFAVLLLLSVRSRVRLLLAAAAGIAVLNLVRHFLLNDFSPERLYTHSFSSHFLLSPFLFEFLAGAVLAAGAGKTPQRLGWPLLVLGLVGFGLAGAANQWSWGGDIEQGYYVMPRVLLFGIPSLLIVQGLVCLEAAGRVAPRQFSLYAGGASYAIYLCHTIFFVATMKMGLNAFLRGLPDLVVQLVYLAYCVLIVVFAVGFYRIAERPLHQAFKRVLRVARLPAARPLS
jgi:peptidoglycan/LPS O-acetylase OafA/YrhL